MKKQVFQIAIIALILSFITPVSAQKNYLSGTVFLHSGEKIEGLINYREWGKNPEKIDFKKAETAEVTRYSPLEIQKFEVADETYISSVVDIEVSELILDRNIKFGNPEFKTESVTVFLRTIVKGNKSLFLYIDKNQKSNFYIFHNENYLLLLYKSYLVRPKESIYERSFAEQHNNKFKGQMQVYLSDCKSIQNKIERSEYELESLRSVFKEYYQSCTESDQFSIKEEKVSLSFGLITGLSLTKTTFSASIGSDSYARLSNTDFPISLNPVFGGTFEIHFPRNQGRISLNNEIIYTSYQTEQSYLDYTDENQYTDSFYRIGSSLIKINSMLRYRFLLNKNPLFIDGGGYFGGEISEENYMKQEIKFYTSERVVEGPALEKTQNVEFGLSFGLGAEIKSFQVEARYEYSSKGVSSMLELSSPTNKVYFLVSYKI